MRPFARSRRFRAALVGALLAAAPAAAPAQADAVNSAEARKLRSAIRNDPLAPTAGARQGDVTVVVFSDYQCPYCHRFNAALDALVQDDPKVRIVFRDWPLQGPNSILAARAAIASQYQNRHAAFHAAIMAGPARIDEASLKAAARSAKVDWNRLRNDMATHKTEIDALITRNFQFARIMGLEGTPSLLVGPYLVPGMIDLATLRATVAKARKAGAQ